MLKFHLKEKKSEAVLITENHNSIPSILISHQIINIAHHIGADFGLKC